MGRIAARLSVVALLALAPWQVARAQDAPTADPCAERVTPPGAAPLPYSEACLRTGFTPGETYVYRMQTADGETQTQIMRMVAMADSGLTLEISRFSGDVPTPPESSEVPWADLAAHATYPADGTTVEETSVDVEAGSFEAWRYEVTGPDGSVVQAYFARDLPGPPVLMTVTAGDQEVMRMELVQHTDGS